ncbi:MAG: phage baseplate assembly protein [Firmicutes bacterium]|nr:phage baseplate assembly protein [Bacillota bacterium]
MDIKSVFGARKGSGKDETFQNMIRYGKVSSVNPKLHTVRVAFADKSGVVSHSLPVLVSGTLKNKHYHLPDVDEDVLCLFLPNGIQRGFVIGSFYNVNNSPPVSSADKEHVTFSDGTSVEYDRSSSTMTIDCVGTINITAASGVAIAGNVTVTGSITASGDVTAGGISLKSHVHSGVEAGGSITGGPQ